MILLTVNHFIAAIRLSQPCASYPEDGAGQSAVRLRYERPQSQGLCNLCEYIINTELLFQLCAADINIYRCGYVRRRVHEGEFFRARSTRCEK